MTTVVHINKSEYDVYIGRGSKWGNPFVIGRDGNRQAVITKYKNWFITQLDLLHDLESLRGKRLGCYCAPLPCHGDFLVEFLEGGMTAEVTIKVEGFGL